MPIHINIYSLSGHKILNLSQIFCKCLRMIYLISNYYNYLFFSNDKSYFLCYIYISVGVLDNIVTSLLTLLSS